jgi:hypothetical protein
MAIALKRSNIDAGVGTAAVDVDAASILKLSKYRPSPVKSSSELFLLRKMTLFISGIGLAETSR